MRTEYIHDPKRAGYDRDDCRSAGTRRTAYKRAPWAAKIAKVQDGWKAFEGIGDYLTWKAQR